MKTLELKEKMELAIKRGKLSHDLTPKEYASLIGGYIQDASKGLRNAVFVAHFAIHHGKDREVKELLSKTYAPQTIHNMFSVGKNIVPLLQDMGATNYRDPFNLMTVSKPLLNPAHPAHSAIMEGVKENKSVSQLRVIRKKLEEVKDGPLCAPRVPVLTITEEDARKAVREACKALAGHIGGGRASMFLASLSTEIQGMKAQTSTLQ